MYFPFLIRTPSSPFFLSFFPLTRSRSLSYSRMPARTMPIPEQEERRPLSLFRSVPSTHRCLFFWDLSVCSWSFLSCPCHGRFCLSGNTVTVLSQPPVRNSLLQLRNPFFGGSEANLQLISSDLLGRCSSRIVISLGLEFFENGAVLRLCTHRYRSCFCSALFSFLTESLFFREKSVVLMASYPFFFFFFFSISLECVVPSSTLFPFCEICRWALSAFLVAGMTSPPRQE